MSDETKVKAVRSLIVSCLSENEYMTAPEIDYCSAGKKLSKKWNVPKNYSIINSVLKKLKEEGAIEERKKEGTAKTREFTLISDYVEPEVSEEPEESKLDDEIEEEALAELKEEEAELDDELAELEAQEAETNLLLNEEEAMKKYKDETGNDAMTSRNTVRKDFLKWKKNNWN